jgi:hypothetical protein
MTRRRAVIADLSHSTLPEWIPVASVSLTRPEPPD